MRVSEFYESGCRDKSFFNSFSKNNHSHIMYTCIKEVCNLLKSGVEKNMILSQVNTLLRSLYDDALFPFTWQKDIVVSDELTKISRFLHWIGDTEIIDANVSISIPYGAEILQSTVSLICRYGNGMYGAINLFPDKACRSPKGKTTHTNSHYDLYALCAKKALEQKYPFIIITNVYLTNGKDSLDNVTPEFIINETMNSNLFSTSYKAYYENGIFLESKLNDAIEKVLSIPVEKNCFGCPHVGLCKVKPISSDTPAAIPKEDNPVTAYTMPTFTPSQQKVVEKESGSMLVCAGPGSGKTATLVGRIQRLIQKGVDPDYILAITFTREAAGELKQRVSSFCADLPYISTIHALCYDILKQNSDLLGKQVKLLNQKERLLIIKDMLEVFPPLAGIQYGYLDGPQGTLKTIERKLDKYLLTHSKNAEAFLAEETSLNYGFIEFAETYAELVEAKGYISFTEQISLCVKLLTENPDVLDMYSSIFQYIMVDEFQDIDKLQAKFIYMLASHGNLVAVGDDDQSIYGFRGGSNQYMLEFKNSFPNAEIIVLEENFRSTQNLVAAAQRVISANTARIQKSVVAGRAQSGSAPTLIESVSKESIESIVTDVLKQGYSLKQIALLSMKNSTLEHYKDTLSIPCVLEKSFLVQDSFFGILKDVLSLYLTDMTDDYSLYHLCRLHGADPRYHGISLYQALLQEGYQDVHTGDYTMVRNDNVYTSLRLLNHAFSQLDKLSITIDFFVQFMAFATGLENSPSIEAIMNFITENHLCTLKEFSDYMNYMVHFGDESKVDVSDIDALHLITNHESKGREFSVVIMIDDFSLDITEETRRLFYVAMTRAKDHLYVLSANNESIAYKELKKGGAA